jgi:hypothetical protein
LTRHESSSPSPIYTCLTKATTAEGDQMTYGVNWMLARRTRLKVYEDHLECGNWRIDYSTIQDAELIVFPSILISGYVLRINTADRRYHFGVNGNAFWKGEMPFAVVRREGKMKYSTFSIAVRILIVGYLGYVVWDRLLR